MAKVSKTTGIKQNEIYTALSGVDCPLLDVSKTGDVVTLDFESNAVITMNVTNSEYIRPITVTYRGVTETWSSDKHIYQASGLTLLVVYDDNFCFVKLNNGINGNNGGAAFLYFKGDNNVYFGYLAKTSSPDVVSVPLIRNSDGEEYRIGNLITFTAPAGTVQFANKGAVFLGDTFQYEILNFISCSTIANESYLTFLDRNFFSIGAHNLVEITEPENSETVGGQSDAINSVS